MAEAAPGDLNEEYKGAMEPVLEGWVMKRSRNIHSWRARWLTLWAGEGSRWSLQTSPEIRGSSQSESFELERVLGVQAVEEVRFGRPHCFTVEYYEGSTTPSTGVVGGMRSVSGLSGLAGPSSFGMLTGSSGSSFLSSVFGRGKVREIGLQASSAKERERWVAALERAVAESVAAAARAAEAKAAAAAAAKAKAQEAPEQPGSGPTSGEAPEAKGKGKGKGKGPPPPPPPAAVEGKGKGKGKGGPPPSGGKGNGKGKGKGKDASPPKAKQEALPFGKRITMWGTAVEVGRERAQDCEGTVFDGLLDEGTIKVEDNIKALNSVFKLPGKAKEGGLAAATAKELAARPAKPKPAAVEVLPHRDAQNLAIVLRVMPVRGPELATVLESLQPGPINAEMLQRLAEIFPSTEQLQALTAYNGPVEALRDVDREILYFAPLPRLPQRLRALQAAAGLALQQEHVTAQLGSIQNACSELKASRTLRLVFAAVLVMFNYVNYGSTGGSSARAFDLATLLHLDKFKAGQGPFKNYNGLHFVVTRLLQEGSGIMADSLGQELGHLQEAAKMNLAEIQASIRLLETEASFLHKEKAEHPEAYGGQPLPPEPVPEPPEPEKEEDDEAGRGLAASCSKRDSRQALRPHSHFRGRFLKECRNFLRTQVLPTSKLANAPPTVPELPPLPPGTPPPAVLLMGDPEVLGEWRPVRVEVAAPGLLVLGEGRGAKEGGLGEARYVVVSGAEVVALNSPLASLEARGAAEACLPANWPKAPSCAFELQGVALQGHAHHKKKKTSGQLWLAAKDPDLSMQWFSALKNLVTAPGAGYIWVKEVAGIWRWRWATLYDSSEGEEASRFLVWHRTPGELLRREHPIGGIRLDAKTEIQTFSESGQSEASRCPYGFRLLNAAGAESRGPAAAEALLCASTRADMDRWLLALRGAPSAAAAAPTPGNTPVEIEDIFSWISAAPQMASQEEEAVATEEASQPHPRGSAAPPPPPRRSLLEGGRVALTEDFASSEATRSPSSSSDSGAERSGGSLRKSRRDLPLHQLGLIALRTDACASQLAQGLASASAECRRLLAYFRQQQHDASPQLLGQQVQNFFSTIQSFSVRLRQAFLEVLQHREACRRRGQPDPFAVGSGKVEQGGKDWQALSLFDLRAPQGPPRRSQEYAWKAQLQVKQAAKAAVADLLEASMRRLCARWLLERAALKALGEKVPNSCPGLAVLELRLKARPGQGRPNASKRAPARTQRRAIGEGPAAVRPGCVTSEPLREAGLA